MQARRIIDRRPVADVAWHSDSNTLTVAQCAMSEDNKLIDLSAERVKRVHELKEKRLNEVREAFEQAMPLAKAGKKPKKKPKKR